MQTPFDTEAPTGRNLNPVKAQQSRQAPGKAKPLPSHDAVFLALFSAALWSGARLQAQSGALFCDRRGPDLSGDRISVNWSDPTTAKPLDDLSAMAAVVNGSSNLISDTAILRRLCQNLWAGYLTSRLSASIDCGLTRSGSLSSSVTKPRRFSGICLSGRIVPCL